MPLSQTRLTKVAFVLKKTTKSGLAVRPVLKGRWSISRVCTMHDLQSVGAFLNGTKAASLRAMGWEIFQWLCVKDQRPD